MTAGSTIQTRDQQKCFTTSMLSLQCVKLRGIVDSRCSQQVYYWDTLTCLITTYQKRNSCSDHSPFYRPWNKPTHYHFKVIRWGSACYRPLQALVCLVQWNLNDLHLKPIWELRPFSFASGDQPALFNVRIVHLLDGENFLSGNPHESCQF